jgi:hypothetical protein
MPVVKIIFGVLCFGIGVGFGVDAIDILLHPDKPGDLAAWGAAMLAAMFLLGSYLLVRRPTPPIG